MIPASLASFLAKPIVKYGVPALIVGGLGLALWIQGQRLHSAKLERDAAQAQVKAYEQAWKARDAADAKKKERDSAFEKTVDQVGRPASPELYLCRLRAVQSGNDPATACGQAGVQTGAAGNAR